MSLNWPLMENNITREDLNTLIKFLKGNPILTQSKNVCEFEREWSEWLGVKYSIFVNSGSSANLAAITALCSKNLDGHMRPGGEVITPAVTFPTTLSPILQNGLVPVLAIVPSWLL
mgnify:CR=1 FL=1